MPISNASLLDENFSDISDWTNGDQAPATSTQVTFDTEETACFDANASAAGNDYAYVYRDIGSIDGLGNTITVSTKLYHDLIGARADNDYYTIIIDRSDWRLYIQFASDGLFVYDGNAWNEVGTDLVQQDVWQEWTIIVDLSGGIANAKCDIWLKTGASDWILVGEDIDCSFDNAPSYVDGMVKLLQVGYTTDDLITYADYLKIGDGSDVTVISDSVINIGDVHKNLVSGVINIGDNWKDLVAGYKNIGGVWKTIF